MKFYHPLKNWVVTQKFGAKSSLYKTKHPGIDLRAQENTTVFAAAPGRVIEVKIQPPYNGYGAYVTIDHGDGYFGIYAHLNSIIVKGGDTVTTGMAIGMSGGNPQRFGTPARSFYVKGQFTQAGKSTAPHLHFEVRKNHNTPAFAIDPLPLLQPNPNLDMPSEFNPDFIPDWAKLSVEKMRRKGFKLSQPNAPILKYELAVHYDKTGLLDKLPDIQ